MTSSTAKPIGILAGNGSLPGEIARAVTAGGGSVQIVAINSEVDDDLSAFPIVHLGLGKIGAILKAFRSAGVEELVIVGGVMRPDLTKLRPDWGLFANLPQVVRLVFSGGDDGVLRVVVRFFEAKGFTVVSPADLVPSLAVRAGSLTSTAPTPGDIADILLGSSVVKALGAYDIGQAVIVSDGKLLAIEAAEGTDRMLARVAGSKHARGSVKPHGVLVKRPKPGQEMRIDLPAIGPATVTRVSQAGLAGIAVLAGQALAAQRHQLLVNARAANVFVYGFTEGDEPPRKRAATSSIKPQAEALGKVRPNAAQLSDVRLGAAALASLAALASSGACVVSRGHILGLEPSCDFGDLFQRTMRLQQWGIARLRRRASVAVLGENVPINDVTIANASEANLAGMAVCGGQSVPAGVIRAADAAGLFLVRMMPAPLSTEHPS
ncbi:MAG: UDP-2,3-diacylglucosamine diphosphatase LpxI [Hyphomicrobiaceae bacterium]